MERKAQAVGLSAPAPRTGSLGERPRAILGTARAGAAVGAGPPRAGSDEERAAAAEAVQRRAARAARLGHRPEVALAAPPAGGRQALPRLPPTAAFGAPTVQRLQGDGLVVNEDDVEVRKTKSRRAENRAEKLHQGTLGVELQGRTERFVKLKVIGLPPDDERDILGMQGWIEPGQADVEPGTIRHDEPLAEAPDQYGPVPGTLFGDDGPSSDDIQQGGLGDCWLIAPMAALADTTAGDQAIRGMIAELPGDRYRVRFHFHAGGGQFEVRTVEISNRFPLGSGGVPTYARTTATKALWPLIVEKAFAEIHGGYFNLKGGSEYNAFAVITGRFPKGLALHREDRDVGLTRPGSGEELFTRLQAAADNDWPVTAGIPKQTKVETLNFLRIEVDDEVSYMGKLSLEPTGRVGLSIKYQGRDAERSLNGVTHKPPQLDLRDIGEDDSIWAVDFQAEPGENRARISVEVTYFTSDLGEEHLVGDHAYAVNEVDQENQTVDLMDPRESDSVVETNLAEIQKYRIIFYIAEI